MKRQLLNTRTILTLLAITLMGFGAQPADAGVLTIDLEYEFSGATAPEGATPWTTATFDDSFGGTNTVRLTMAAANLVGTEHITTWMFNFDPTLDPTQLSFGVVDNSASFPNAINTGLNAFQADGDGFFDIQFEFPPPPGDFASKFTAGESVVYDITYVAAITASSFDFGSAPGGGAGTYRSAAHVQGIGTDGNYSGWIGDGDGPNPTLIPEPSSLAVWGLGMLAAGLCLLRRRRSAG